MDSPSLFKFYFKFHIKMNSRTDMDKSHEIKSIKQQYDMSKNRHQQYYTNLNQKEASIM